MQQSCTAQNRTDDEMSENCATSDAKVTTESNSNTKYNVSKGRHSHCCPRKIRVQKVSTNFSILSSCNKCVKISCHFQTSYNLLKQLAASLWITSFDNQLATILLTSWNRLVVNKLSQAMRMHPDIGLLITSLLEDDNRLVVICVFLTFYQKWGSDYIFET